MSDLHGLCEPVHTSGETLVERRLSGLHERWPLCPTHMQCRGFCKRGPVTARKEGIGFRQRTDVFCRRRNLLGVCDWCGRVSARMSKAPKQTQTLARDVERSQPE
jgi:hypothetical protein